MTWSSTQWFFHIFFVYRLKQLALSKSATWPRFIAHWAPNQALRHCCTCVTYAHFLTHQLLWHSKYTGIYTACTPGCGAASLVPCPCFCSCPLCYSSSYGFSRWFMAFSCMVWFVR
jgi:hypothetical protein